MNQVFIDVTILEPRMKHPAIFEAFDGISGGSSVVIHNDHDPKPLYYQLLGERGNCFSWNYLSNGPEIWEVEIKKNEQPSETVGEIAAKDMRKAELLRKLGIDFCCGGKKSIEDACRENGLDVIRVKDALEAVNQDAGGVLHDFTSFSLSFFSDYIVNVHHSYVFKNLPVIEDLAQKVASHHGGSFPFLAKVYSKVNELRCELLTHMKKEEQVLFPYIKQLEMKQMSQRSFETIKDPILVMEREHEIAGDLLREVRHLTGDYSVPEGGCNSLRMLYSKLEAFEADLFQHIHLENNILFPKAMAIEQQGVNE